MYRYALVGNALDRDLIPGIVAVVGIELDENLAVGRDGKVRVPIKRRTRLPLRWPISLHVPMHF